VKVYSAVVDEWGIWVDFEVKYEGCIELTIETKVNLMKLKDASAHDSSTLSMESPWKMRDLGFAPFSPMTLRTPSRYSDEEAPESPETSPDEEFGSRMKQTDLRSARRKKVGKKLLGLVDRIAHSSIFKEATDLKPIKSLMEDISSTRLILNVQITHLEGTMTINLPAPPSDRIWYGFRKPPIMNMKAIPQVGDRSVALSTVSDWIENKLVLLLEKALVVPNLDDIVVPLLQGNQLLKKEDII